MIMKKLFPLILLFLFSCGDDKPKEKLPDPPKQEMIPDLLFEDTKKDSLEQTMRRRPRPKPPVIDTSGSSTYIPPTILLDFDGHVTKGTSWNVSGDIVCEPSGLDAAGQKLVYDSVVSYYKQFKNPLFITTDEAKFLKVPLNERIRVVITISHAALNYPLGGVGGVAYLNSFTWGTDEPCFVFSALHRFNLRNIADCAAHESGHTLGLRHQSTWVNGVMTSGYNWGDGVRAPIAGASYNASIPTFCWVGLNSANQLQNDTSTMQSKF